jgi:guanylate kinase
MKNLICVSAPSGSGKTTLCKAIREAKPELIWSVSYTTRRPRHNEINGEDYNFISKEEFISLIDNEKFAEYENVHGQYYGTIKYKLEDGIKKNKIVLLDLDVNGAMSICRLYPNNAHSIFIVPQSIEHLRKRLKTRGSETNKIIEKRLKRFNKEIEYKDKFDTLLINDNIQVAINDFITTINEITIGVN